MFILKVSIHDSVVSMFAYNSFDILFDDNACGWNCITCNIPKTLVKISPVDLQPKGADITLTEKGNLNNTA